MLSCITLLLAVTLPVDFTAGDGKVRETLEIPVALSQDSMGIAFDLVVPDVALFSGFSFMLRCGDGWYYANHIPEEGRHSVVLPRAELMEQRYDSPGPWGTASKLRIHVYRKGSCTSGRTEILVEGFHPMTAAEMCDYGSLCARRRADSLARLSKLKNVKGERRLAWCHYEYGLGGTNNWDSSARILKECGFTDVLANLAWGGVASYPSRVLETAGVVPARGSALDQCLTACRKYGVKCHAWIVMWNSRGRAAKGTVDRWVRDDRVQKSADGKVECDWWCPSNPENRRCEFEAMVELARAGVDGVHLDYIRYPGEKYCLCDGCRRRFEKAVGRTISEWPSAMMRDSALSAHWAAFRRDSISAFVKQAAEGIRRQFPHVEISAAVVRMQDDGAVDVGQDWTAWCRQGWMDFICPMNYTPSCRYFRELALGQKEAVGKTPLYPGIGMCGSGAWPKDGSEAARFADQVEIVRELELGGFSFFNFDLRALPVIHSPNSPFYRRIKL